TRAMARSSRRRGGAREREEELESSRKLEGIIEAKVRE
ncbi:hypothetical protein A2U01_0102500, partial [Trifolium medium]|nr:hypothetical protein [Trifolium medium]